MVNNRILFYIFYYTIFGNYVFYSFNWCHVTVCRVYFVYTFLFKKREREELHKDGCVSIDKPVLQRNNESLLPVTCVWEDLLNQIKTRKDKINYISQFSFRSMIFFARTNWQNMGIINIATYFIREIVTNSIFAKIHPQRICGMRKLFILQDCSIEIIQLLMGTNFKLCHLDSIYLGGIVVH